MPNADAQTSTQNWMTSHPEFIYDWTDESCDLTRSANVKNNDWPSLVVDTSSSFIRQAKDLQVGPAEIRKRITALHKSQPLLNMCCDIYSSYQQALRYRSAVDFDDLIRMALQALQSDEEYLDLLRKDKKTMNAGLQLADLVVSPIGRMIADYPSRADWTVIEKKFRRSEGDYFGTGLTVLP